MSICFLRGFREGGRRKGGYMIPFISAALIFLLLLLSFFVCYKLVLDLHHSSDCFLFSCFEVSMLYIF